MEFSTGRKDIDLPFPRFPWPCVDVGGIAFFGQIGQRIDTLVVRASESERLREIGAVRSGNEDIDESFVNDPVAQEVGPFKS